MSVHPSAKNHVSIFVLFHWSRDSQTARSMGHWLSLPVEHVALVLILGMLELLMLQCSMLLETFQNSKQLDLTGLSAGNLSKNKI